MKINIDFLIFESLPFNFDLNFGLNKDGQIIRIRTVTHRSLITRLIKGQVFNLDEVDIDLKNGVNQIEILSNDSKHKEYSLSPLTSSLIKSIKASFWSSS
jgi:hypothetical protein